MLVVLHAVSDPPAISCYAKACKRTEQPWKVRLHGGATQAFVRTDNYENSGLFIKKPEFRQISEPEAP